MEPDKAKEEEYVDFNQIKQYVGITDPNLFRKYLKEVYKDLADRSGENKKQGIIKLTFQDYINLPVIISEKLFSALDKDNDGFLKVEEFIHGMENLFNGTFEQTITTIFQLLDFNNKGLIQREDVKILFGYLPFKTDHTKTEYKYQMESQGEIEEILASTFGSKDSLNLSEFIKVTENKKSDVFLQLLCFIYQKKPFSEENINELNSKKNEAPPQTPKQTFSKMVSHLEGKYLPSPNKKSSLSPASSFFVSSSLISKFELNPKKEKTPLVSGTNGMIRFHNENIPKKEDDDSTESKNVRDIIKNSQTCFMSPSSTMKMRKKGLDKLKNFSLDGQLTEIGPSENKEENQEGKEVKAESKPGVETKAAPKEDLPHEGSIYKLIEGNGVLKLKKFYLVLIGKDIYYYRNNKKQEKSGMHNLSGCFVKETGYRSFNNVNYYSFQIVFPSKVRTYYCASKEERDDFVFAIKGALGYLNFFDYYEILDTIGEGIFGVVSLGVYKKTGERVAIKIIKKETTNKTDMELVRTEIDIMKLCHHPNIVKLLDHFENADYIFIVMELITGGVLSQYMTKKKFNFTEERAAEIIYEIATGLKYLHHFGIIHRDLKPDNVMLTECSDLGKVKIMDFGLSKILGSSEKSVDGFGTLTFVAPEVLLRTPYSKEIDIWSLGVILFLMLSGMLPFDDQSDNEEVIAKKIVYTDLMFPDCFKARSKSVVDLISKCLIKEPDKRIKLDELLKHEWFKEFKKN